MEEKGRTERKWERGEWRKVEGRKWKVESGKEKGEWRKVESGKEKGWTGIGNFRIFAE